MPLIFFSRQNKKMLLVRIICALNWNTWNRAYIFIFLEMMSFWSIFKISYYRPLLLYFHLFYCKIAFCMVDKILSMAEFELGISGVRSNRSTNQDTTTAHLEWCLLNSDQSTKTINLSFMAKHIPTSHKLSV